MRQSGTHGIRGRALLCWSISGYSESNLQYVDIDYDPPMGVGASLNASGTFAVVNDGGDFYREVIRIQQTPIIAFSLTSPSPPIQSENDTALQVDKWAIYGSEIRWTVAPRAEFTSMEMGGTGLWLGWSLPSGSVCEVQSCASFTTGQWRRLTVFTTETDTTTWGDEGGAGSSPPGSDRMRFYRIRTWK